MAPLGETTKKNTSTKTYHLLKTHLPSSETDNLFESDSEDTHEHISVKVPKGKENLKPWVYMQLIYLDYIR